MAQPNLLLVSATELESGVIQKSLGDAQTTQHAGKTVIVGNLCDWRCTLLHTGIGSVKKRSARTDLSTREAAAGLSHPIWNRWCLCANRLADSVRSAGDGGNLRRCRRSDT